MSVTLSEVLAASSIRAASLVPETSGYLALAVADASARLPFRLDDPLVSLTTEGTVKVARGSHIVAPEESARRVRDVLARLLGQSIGSAPALSAAARPRQESDEGVDRVIRELEAALVPVNRAAARRALARLARETVRAKDSGKLRRRRSSRKNVLEEEAPAEPAPAPAPAPVAKRAAPVPQPVMPAPVQAEESIDVEFSAPPAPSEPKEAIAVERVETQPAASVEQEEQAEQAEPEPQAADLEATPFEPEPSFVDEVPTTIDAAVEPDFAALALSESVTKSSVDDLLDRFAVSALTTPESMSSTRASLKRLAGLDPTPPPPSAEELKKLTVRPPAVTIQLRAEPKRQVAPAVPVPPARQASKWVAVALIAFGLVLAGLVGHYLPTWINGARAAAEAAP